MKELHFYTDLSNEEQTSEWDLDTMCIDFINTKSEIEHLLKKGGTVKTTQLTFLSDAWDYIDSGVEVFVHIRNEVICIKDKFTSTDDVLSFVLSDIK